MRASLTAGLALLCACSSPPRPAPQLSRVVPSEIARGQPAVVTIEGQNLFADLDDPFWSAQPAALDLHFVVRVGDVTLADGSVTQLGTGALSVSLPADLPLGLHPVTVRTPGGAEATLVDALLVSDVVVASLHVEDAAAGAGADVPAQQLFVGGAPLELFAISRSQTGRYLGWVGASWSQTATLGTLTAATDGASATLMPTTVGVGRIVATPLAGGASAETGDLTVAVESPSLAFVTAARSAAAGSCAGPLTVEARSRGVRTNAAVVTPVAFAATPALEFFSDPGCLTAASSVDIPAGSATADVYVRGTVVGTSAITASSSFGNANQDFTVTPGPLARFVWAPIPSERSGIAFAVTISAEDAYANPIPTYAGSASLSLTGDGVLQCTQGCAAALTAGPFAGGQWTGSVGVTSTLAGNRTLTATDGAATGTSAPFTLVPNRSPPLAKIYAVTNGASLEGSTVTFDASASTDLQTPPAGLQFSFDFSGINPNPPPWTAWSSNPVATFAGYTGPNWLSPRVAVRDSDGDVGYSATVVVALKAANTPCVVTEPNAAFDDGATNCTGASGPDGKLSLAEAIRLSAGGNGRKAIGFARGLTVTGPATFTISTEVWFVGTGDTVLRDVNIVAANGGTVVLSALDYSSTAASPLVAQVGGLLALENARAHDFAGFSVHGSLWTARARMDHCGGACVTLDTNSAYTNLRTTLFADSPVGLTASACTGTAPGIDAVGVVFARLSVGAKVQTGCNAAQLINATFDANTLGLDAAGGSGHMLQNVIFTGNTTAQSCGAGTFVTNDQVLLFGNASDGCAANTAATLRADPLFVAAENDDYRLLLGSPAIDSGAVYGTTDLNDSAPGNFTGVAPDRGGAESY